MGKGTIKSREEREKEREREEAKAEKNATSAKGTESAAGSVTQTSTQKKEKDAYLTEKAETSAKGTGISIAQTSAQKKEKDAYLTEKNATSAKGTRMSRSGSAMGRKSAYTGFYIPPVIGWDLFGNERSKPYFKQALARHTYGDLPASLMDFYQSVDHYKKTKALAGKNIITDMQAINTPAGAEVDMKRKEAWFQFQLDKSFRTLAEQKIADDPVNRFWESPISSANEQPFYRSAVDTGLEKQLKGICDRIGIDYAETLASHIRDANAEQTRQRNEAMAEMAEERPGLMSAVSVMMMPTDVVGALYGVANSAAGRPIDVNSPAYMGTNSRMAARNRVRENIEETYGAAVGAGYDIAMAFFDATYGAVAAGGGKVADGIEAASSAVNTYISLINSGVSPEIAGVQAGLQVGLDLVDLTGVGDEVLGAALKKAGLDDLLLRAVKPGSAAGEMLEEVEERTYWALLESGMDSYDLDLTPAQRKEISDAIAIETGMTEEEIGKLAKLIQTGDSDLTFTPWGDIIEESASSQLDTIKSRNMKLENTTHPVTGVPFKRVVVEMDGRQVEVVAPEFEYVGEVSLTEDLYTVSSKLQKKYCNMDLFNQIQQNPEIGQNFTDEEILLLNKGKTPAEYVWHHDVHAGRMLLVDKEKHSKTGHTGGYYIWGYKFLSRKGGTK